MSRAGTQQENFFPETVRPASSILNSTLSRVSRVKPNKAIILPAGPATPDGFIQRTTPAPTVPSSELSSLKKATGDFSESNIIGRGGFGIVYEVRTSNYGFQCLINRILSQHLFWTEILYFILFKKSAT